MFYERWTKRVSYTNLDKDLIGLLYNENMISGLNEEEAEVVLSTLIKEGIADH